ncbi:MAG TPA: OAM dimerization domain-containing protein [Myxococcales bacterium]|nr:OAM dimerization domain-containing protein [Myxococcales bacterium]
MSEKHLIRPYGDRKDDGVVQLSFVLPVPVSEKAKEAAAQVAKKLGLSHVLVSAMEKAGEDYSFFVVYGRTHMQLDYASIEVPVIEHRKHGFDELNDVIERDVGRKIVVVGACIGTDSHTTGIDAIMNMKGFAGDYGLERYPWIDAVNLGAQVPCERLLREAHERSADAILVSQVVTQKQVHARQLTKLVDLLEAEGLRDRYLLIAGGPRLSNTFAKELGYDAGFGPGSTPSQVAAWVATELIQRKGE